jgi:hypothetical protein
MFLNHALFTEETPPCIDDIDSADSFFGALSLQDQQWYRGEFGAGRPRFVTDLQSLNAMVQTCVQRVTERRAARGVSNGVGWGCPESP